MTLSRYDRAVPVDALHKDPYGKACARLLQRDSHGAREIGMSGDNPILFYFDYISPTSYLASRLIDKVADKHGRDTDWRCISVNQIFRELNATPPAIAPRKSTYVSRDLARLSEYFGIPIEVPKKFPVACGPARQAFYHIKATDSALAKAFASALLEGYWIRGLDIGEPDGIQAAMADSGVDEEMLAAAFENAEAKQQVKQEAEDAAAYDLFGVPFMVADGEPFFGADRIEFLDRFLAEKAG